MTVKKTQQTLSSTLEKTEQTLGGLENSLGNDVEASLLAITENSEVNDGLPEGWCGTTLGKFTEYGKSKKVERKDVSDDLWLLELEDVEKGSSKIIQRLSVSERAFKSTKNKFEKGSVLYGKLRPYLNKIVMAPEDGVCTTEIIPINVEPFGSNKYLFYWLKSGEFLGYINKVSYGVNMPRLGTKDGLSAPLILPPLAEQTVIAQTLDTLLAQVDNIKTRLDAIPKILKTFRQSVLAAAVSGKLTEEWRGENECGEWVSIKLEDVTGIIDPQPSHRTPPVVEGGIPYIGIGDLTDDGSIDFDRARKVSRDVLKEHNNRYALKKGDFVFGKIGTLGKATKLPIDRDYTLSANVILIQPDLEFTDPAYVMHFLSCPETMAEVARQSNSTSQAAFGIKKMRAFKCSFPPLEEQTQIVYRVEELFAFADEIEQQVKNAQGRVNNLTQSILAKAFRGELTAQWRADNPDLISGDNSAEVLLEKIKQEREALKKSSKPKKKTAVSASSEKGMSK